jgi:hypothetical protein
MSNKTVTRVTEPESQSNLMARKRTSCAMALSLLCVAMIVGRQSNPASQFATSSKMASMGSR